MKRLTARCSTYVRLACIILNLYMQTCITACCSKTYHYLWNKKHDRTHDYWSLLLLLLLLHNVSQTPIMHVSFTSTPKNTSLILQGKLVYGIRVFLLLSRIQAYGVLWVTKHLHTHTHTNTHRHTHTHTNTQTHIDKQIHTHRQTHTQPHTHKHK
jgi:hypothetical protein